LLSDLFNQFGIELEDYHMDILNEMVRMIQSSDVLETAKPPIIHTLSDILFSIYKDKSEEEKDSVRSQFIEILSHYRELQYPTNTEDDIKLANEFLESVAHGHDIFGKLYFVKNMDIKLEKEMLIDISRVCDAIRKVNNYSEETLKSALEMLLEYSHNTSRKNNVTLNKGVNHKIIDLAKELKSLEELAKRVKTTLGNT
jgi:hypothetical protein